MRLLFIVLITLLITACDTPVPDQVLKISGPTMGTQYHISWVGQDPDQASVLQAQVDERLRQINKNMSTYDPASELSRLNQAPSSADWRELSADLSAVLGMALQVWERSGGAFDVTVGPLVNLWGFGPQARPETVPSADDIQRVRAAIGSQQIVLDAAQQRLRLQAPLYIDLSAIAKGWAVDDIAALLERNGVVSYMVEIGGELRTRGLKPGQHPWRIAIERPQSVAGHEAALVIEPGAMGVATSGDYRNYFEEDGVRYSHTIDPATGYPVRHTLASVTVVHESTGLADAWATALSVAGPDKGMALAEQNGLAVLMLVREQDAFAQRTSSRFNELFPHAAVSGE